MTSPGSSGVAACRQRTIGLRELVSGYPQFHEGVQWDTEGTQSNNPNKTKIMSSKWLISAKSCKLLYVLVLGGISSTGCSHYTQLWLFIEHIPLSHHVHIDHQCSDIYTIIIIKHQGDQSLMCCSYIKSDSTKWFRHEPTKGSRWKKEIVFFHFCIHISGGKKSINAISPWTL